MRESVTPQRRGALKRSQTSKGGLRFLSPIPMSTQQLKMLQKHARGFKRARTQWRQRTSDYFKTPRGETEGPRAVRSYEPR